MKAFLPNIIFLPLKFQNEVWLYPYVMNTQWKSGWLTNWPLIHSFTHLLIHTLQHSHSWEANSSSTNHKIPTFYGTQRFIHNNMPFVPLLKPDESSPCLRIPFLSFNIIHLPNLFLPSCCFPSGFPNKPCAHFSFSPHLPHEIIRTQEVNICEKN